MTLSRFICRIPRTISTRQGIITSLSNPLQRSLASTSANSTTSSSPSSSASSSPSSKSFPSSVPPSNTTGTSTSGITTTLTNNGVLVIRLDTPNEKVRTVISIKICILFYWFQVKLICRKNIFIFFGSLKTPE